MKHKLKQDYFITVVGENKEPFTVYVTRSPHKVNWVGKENTWYTTDLLTEIGEPVTVENMIGARISVKRIN